MKLKSKALLVLAVIGCIAGLAKTPFIFFPIILTTLYIIILSELLLFATNVILKFLPSRITEYYRKYRVKFRTITFTCSAFLYISLWVINRYLLPGQFHPISLIGDAVILLFTVFLVWGFISIEKRRKIIVRGIIAFFLIISLLAYSSSKVYIYIEPSTAEALKSLPYLVWTPVGEDIDKIGVTKYNSTLSYKGPNIYNSKNDVNAYLIDMSGKAIHVWSDGISQWSHVEMYRNGDLLGIFENKNLVKLDWNSRVKWRKPMRVHHDISIAEDGTIYVLARKDELILDHGGILPLLNDYIFVLSPEGNLEKELSFYKIFKDKIPPDRVSKIRRWIIMPRTLLEIFAKKIKKGFAFEGRSSPADIFHSNTVEVINRDINGICKKGDLLICIRNLDIIGIINTEREELIWQWGRGELDGPHHPTLLKNGNILIFDNNWNKEYSRVIELDPVKRKIVWEYKSDPPEDFFSLMRGASQRLPNNNTLITESDRGRVFEITPTGQIVWEYYNPEVKRQEGQRRAIYRMMRITNPEKYPHLKGLGQ